MEIEELLEKLADIDDQMDAKVLESKDALETFKECLHLLNAIVQEVAEEETDA